MIFIPFIFFTIIFIYILFKRGFDVSSYIVLLYIVTSFASVLMYKSDYLDYELKNISILPTIIYCGLIGLSIYPIYSLNCNKLIINIQNYSKTIDYLVYFFFGCFLIYFFGHFRDLIYRFAFGDFGQLRADIYSEEDIATSSYGGILGLLLTISGVFGSASQIMMPIFFITLVYMKKPFWYKLMAITGSFTYVLIGIMGIDRSKSFYFLIILGLCWVFFKNRINKHTRLAITLLIVLIFGLVLSYIAIVTNDRFNEGVDGNKGGIISYAGQSFPNFCYFWDNFYNPGGFSTKYLLPATHHYIIGDYNGAVVEQQKLDRISKIQTGVFYTFLGSFLIDNNKMGPFLFIFIYLIIFYLFKRKIKQNNLSFLFIIILFILLFIPACGIMLYYYTSYYTTLSLFCIFLFVKYFNRLKFG